MLEVIIDTETTGLSITSKNIELVEIGCVELE